MSGKRKAEATRWFRQAGFDLEASRWSSQGGFHDTACFLAQQAGEKALKSLLYHIGARREALLTHSLFDMVRESSKTLEWASGLLGPARELDIHHIPSRYPNGLPSGFPHEFYAPETAERAAAAAERILRDVARHFERCGDHEIVGGESER